MYGSVCNTDGSPRGYIARNDSQFDTAREALRDVSQLEFFFDQIGLDPDKGKYTRIMERIVGDCDRRLWRKLAEKGVLGVLFDAHCPLRLNGEYVARTMTDGVETAGNARKMLWLGFKDRFAHAVADLR